MVVSELDQADFKMDFGGMAGGNGPTVIAMVSDEFEYRIGMGPMESYPERYVDLRMSLNESPDGDLEMNINTVWWFESQPEKIINKEYTVKLGSSQPGSIFLRGPVDDSDRQHLLTLNIARVG
jgi:hypothetical protein